MCKAKRWGGEGWKFKEEGKKNLKKEVCVQHFESGHGALHEHHPWPEAQSLTQRSSPTDQGPLAHCSQYTVVNAVKQEGYSALQSV